MPAKSPNIASAPIREKTAGGGATSLEQMMNQLKVAGISKFPLIIKGDVQGSVEAIIASLNKLSTDEVSAQILMSGVGAITESDVTLATASNAIIIGFNVRANKQASDLATRDGIEIRYYNIIYDLVDDVKAAMSGLLKPERRETFIGYAKILEVFQITKVGKVAGCRVTEGIVERGAGVSPAARQRRYPRRQAQDAQALQGRGQGSPGRPGMRHGLRELRRHPRRRRHRMLPRGAGAPARCKRRSKSGRKRGASAPFLFVHFLEGRMELSFKLTAKEQALAGPFKPPPLRGAWPPIVVTVVGVIAAIFPSLVFVARWRSQVVCCLVDTEFSCCRRWDGAWGTIWAQRAIRN